MCLGGISDHDSRKRGREEGRCHVTHDDAYPREHCSLTRWQAFYSLAYPKPYRLLFRSCGSVLMEHRPIISVVRMLPVGSAIGCAQAPWNQACQGLGVRAEHCGNDAHCEQLKVNWFLIGARLVSKR